jgi:hypothetical protein
MQPVKLIFKLYWLSIILRLYSFLLKIGANENYGEVNTFGLSKSIVKMEAG